MVHVISLDIDGTLVFGDGPGPITLEMVRRALEHGHIVGSASDRPIAAQKALWEAAGITVEFTINKHKLDEIRSRYEAECYYHIGDTDLDRHYAVLNGFDFYWVQTMDPHPWMLDDAGEARWGPQGRGQVLDVPVPIAQAPTPAPADEADSPPGDESYDYSNG